MTTERRKFTAEERLSILQEGEREGQASTIRKYHLHLPTQFIANKVRYYLRYLEANQEFTHIATPEENSYIGYYEAKLTLAAYMDHYNKKRKHGSLNRNTPMQKWNEYFGSFSSDMHLPAQVSEGLSRVSARVDTRLDLDKSGDTANFANRLMNENNENIKQEVLKSFNKSVQLIGG